MIESTRLKKIAKQFGTPLYVYDADTAIKTYRQVAESIEYPHTQIFYAAVANSNPALLNLFHQEGAGIHANTIGDAWIALKSGIERSSIIMTGSNLTDEELGYVVKNNLYVNLDSLSQLEKYLSLNPYTPPGIRVHLNCLGKSRIGLSVDEVPNAIKLSQKAGLPLSGLHFYGGTGTLGIQRYVDAFNELFEIARHIPHLKYMDVGGGFGFDYRDPSNQGLSWTELGSLLDKHMKALAEHHGCSIELWLEPGRCLIAESGVLLAQIVDIKTRDGIRYLGTNTSVSNIAVLSVHGGYRRVQIVGKDHNDDYATAYLCGSTTFSNDFLAKGVPLPPAEEGDLVAILDCGAYGYAMSNNFLACPRPAEVLYQDSRSNLIRRRESYDDLLSHVEPVALKTIGHNSSDG